MAKYLSVVIPFEPNVKLQTSWHPTAAEGSLTRGNFKNKKAAQTWVDSNLPKGTRYTFKKFDDGMG